MKHDILQSHLDEFSTKFNLKEQDESVQFEFFANYCIISKLYPSEIEDLEDLSTGGGNDTGIDGLAIIVNGNLIKNKEEIEDLININHEIDVQFIFLQIKSSAKFEGAQVVNFLCGVKNFFQKNSSLKENNKIINAREIKDFIYKQATKFYSGLPPEIKLYYVTTGEWTNPNDVIQKANMILDELNNFRIFRGKPTIEFVDADKLQKNYRELGKKIERRIYFPKYTTIQKLPENLGVTQSFIGCISIKEYIKLITDDSDNLLRELFYDNVRDYQGLNKINKEIQETIIDSKNKYLMPLLNNGITIIAKKAQMISEDIILRDYQIVNGCQTSHILYHQRHKNLDDTFIVAKIIETNNQEVINKIITGTNKQTEVKDEAFESIKPFHIKLSELFLAKSKKSAYPIYYERRSKEYSNQKDINMNQIVTLSYLTKCYVASILQQPQSTHRYFGELISSNKNIFSNEKNLEDYYNASYILKIIENLFITKKLYNSFKEYKYHILFLIFIRFKDKKEISNLLISKNIINLETYCVQACQIITKAKKTDTKYNSNYKNIRNKDFTLLLKQIESEFEYKD